MFYRPWSKSAKERCHRRFRLFVPCMAGIRGRSSSLHLQQYWQDEAMIGPWPFVQVWTPVASREQPPKAGRPA